MAIPTSIKHGIKKDGFYYAHCTTIMHPTMFYIFMSTPSCELNAIYGQNIRTADFDQDVIVDTKDIPKSHYLKYLTGCLDSRQMMVLQRDSFTKSRLTLKNVA